MFVFFETLVALRIDKDALFSKIRMFERSEFGFLRMFLASLKILRATWFQNHKQFK